MRVPFSEVNGSLYLQENLKSFGQDSSRADSYWKGNIASTTSECYGRNMTIEFELVEPLPTR